MEDMKNSSLFAAAFHRFISQPASSRSSALLSLATFLVLSFFGELCGYTVYFSDPRSRYFARSLQTLKAVVAVFVDAYNHFGAAKSLFRKRHPNNEVPFAVVDFL